MWSAARQFSNCYECNCDTEDSPVIWVALASCKVDGVPEVFLTSLHHGPRCAYTCVGWLGGAARCTERCVHILPSIAPEAGPRGLFLTMTGAAHPGPRLNED